MVAITATNSATPSVQSSLGRARLEQARREADQAETRARDLRVQADQAEQESQQSQSTVRKLTSDLASESSTYAAPKASRTAQAQAPQNDGPKAPEPIPTATSVKREVAVNALKRVVAPVSMGQLINITA